ncbi:hypothetical protein SAMN05421736_101565 [Evansella caseinilytica]|uniref:Uncharacterized protein n=1 Tax=Evansella caseinilytica TaxID=1503961 RepID=A0A1H3HRE9_9BACI|nr:hypothetical protein [Evansella caseinilytica]SDY17249.1 hypothetical protein SAMN05421736_101565 [Evansella caseinilytica]
MSNLESLCIRVDKVYDWVTRQVNKEYNFNGVNGLADLAFTCNGTPDDNPCELLGPNEDFIVTVIPTDENGNEIPLNEIECSQVGLREDVFVPELDTELQLVRIKKQGFFVVELRIDPNFPPVCVSAPISYCIFERFLLCAPEGTVINCHVFDFDGSGAVCCANGEFIDLTLELLICQSIQVEAEVKIEVEGRLCKPREDIILPIERVCPEITFPPQCPEIFPPANH